MTFQRHEPMARHFERFREGDEVAFERLFEVMWPMAVAQAKRVLRHDQDAEDAAARAFGCALRERGRSAPIAHFGAWFKKIVRNEAIKLKRALRRWENLPDNETEESHEFARETSVSHTTDELSEIAQAAARLDQPYKEAVELHYVFNLSHREAATRLGCPPATFSWRIGAAHEAILADLLQGSKGTVGDAIAITYFVPDQRVRVVRIQQPNASLASGVAQEAELS